LIINRFSKQQKISNILISFLINEEALGGSDKISEEKLMQFSGKAILLFSQGSRLPGFLPDD